MRGVSTDFKRVSVCVGLHVSTLQSENIKEKGTHRATIWTISIIMEKPRVSVEVSRASHSMKGMLTELGEKTSAVRRVGFLLKSQRPLAPH